MIGRMIHFRRFKNDTSGHVAVLTALLLSSVVAASASALDLALVHQRGDQLQKAADAAALSAARDALFTTNDAQVRETARQYALAELAGKSSSVTINTAIDRSADVKVSISLTAKVDLIFGEVVKLPDSVTRAAVAVGGAKKPVCLLVLEPSAAGAMSLQGTPDLVADNCIVQVNSKSSSALAMGGNATVSSLETRVSSQAQKGKGSASGFKPPPKYESPAMPDPLAEKVKWPTTAGCQHFNGHATKTKRTLSPGVYCGGISASTHGELHLEPGLYVLQTGSLTLGSGGSIKGPSGVTIVMLDPTGLIDVHSKGSLSIEAPRSGPWDGIAIAVKPQPLKLTSNMQGGGEMHLDGVIYLPSQRLHLTGGGAMDGDIGRRMLVVNSIELGGNGQVRLKGDPNIASVASGVRLVK